MNANHRADGVRRIINDLTDLCELQWQLLQIDSQEARRYATRSFLLLVITACLLLPGLLAAALSAGWLIHEFTALSVGFAFLVVSIAVLLFAAICGFLSLRTFSKASASLSETRREFSENVRWVRSVFLKPSTSARNQLRHESFSPSEVPHNESRFQHFR
jgi:uncharacterized membrane protein YqjE